MILIKNVQIIDGSGKPGFRADILVDGRKISAIGNFPQKKAEETVDGLGLTAVPGFIDVNTDSDHYLSLFTYPQQTDFLLQGVTTILGGQCGSSLAPLLYGSLVSIRKWADPNQVNIGWNTMAEFLGVLRRMKLGVNFGTLVGHSTVRRDIIGEAVRDLTQPELDVFLKILNESLKEGALGFSTGLGYVHARFTPYSEIKALAQAVAKSGKLYTTHLRDEKKELLKSIQETILVAQETGSRTVISHFRPVIGFEKEFQEAVSLIEKNLVKANIYFDVNPFAASLIPIYSLLPDWAQNGGVEVMLENLANESTRKEISEILAQAHLEDLVVAEARGQQYIIGKTLGELAKNREKGIVDYVLELMAATKLQGLLSYKNISEELLEKVLFHPRSLIGSNGASLPEKHKGLKLDRSTSTFPKFLEMALSRNVPVEEAVKKITSAAAQVIGIKNRGLIKEGYLADIVLLKDNKIITDVLVNGQFAVRNSAFTGQMNGDVL